MSKLAKVEKSIQKKKEGELIKLAHDKDQEVRLAAIAGMGQVGSGDSFNNLVTFLRDPSPAIRAASATSLGLLRDNHADADLRHRLESEKDEQVISAIKSALALLHKEGL